jgi:hypothetical protein
MKKITGRKPNHHFKRAAEALVANYNSPTDFLLFVTDVIDWIYNYEVSLTERDEKNDQHYNFILIIERIVIPWLNSTEENRITDIAVGIEKYRDFCGCEGHYMAMAKLFAAFSKELESFAAIGPEWMNKYMLGINTLTQVGNSLFEYERKIIFSREKETLTKVA